MYIIIEVNILFFNYFLLDINCNKLSNSTYKFITTKMLSLTKGNVKTRHKSIDKQLLHF